MMAVIMSNACYAGCGAEIHIDWRLSAVHGADWSPPFSAHLNHYGLQVIQYDLCIWFFFVV